MELDGRTNPESVKDPVIRRFVEYSHGLEPEECGYFGNGKYRNVYVYGITQEDVDAYISQQKFIRWTMIGLCLLCLFVIIPLLIYAVLHQNMIAMSVAIALSLSCIIFLICAYIKGSKKEEQLKERIFTIY